MIVKGELKPGDVVILKAAAGELTLTVTSETENA
jgi:ferredoxin-NADP reductase